MLKAAASREMSPGRPIAFNPSICGANVHIVDSVSVASEGLKCITHLLVELPTSNEVFNSRGTQTITPVNLLGRSFVIASLEHLCDNAVHSCNLLRRIDEPFFAAAVRRS